MPDATTLIHINQCNTNKQNVKERIVDLDQKIPDFRGLVTTTVLNTRIDEAENKFSNVTGLVKNQIMMLKYQGKCITNYDYNKFASDILNAMIKQKGLVNTANISNLVKNFDLNTKLATLATSNF